MIYGFTSKVFLTSVALLLPACFTYLSTLSTFALFGPPVHPVVLYPGLFPILSYTNVPECRFAGELHSVDEGADATVMGYHVAC